MTGGQGRLLVDPAPEAAADAIIDHLLALGLIGPVPAGRCTEGRQGDHPEG